MYVPGGFTVAAMLPLGRMQLVLFTTTPETTNAWFSSVTTIVAVVVQPFASSTVTEYVPAGILSRSCVVALLDQSYEYGAGEPEMVRSIEPLLSPQVDGSTT